MGAAGGMLCNKFVYLLSSVQEKTRPVTVRWDMPTINIQAEVSVDVLVKAVEQLREAELRQFTAQV